MTIRARREHHHELDAREMPAYTTHEAARYVRVPENTLRAWVFGRRYPTRRGQGQASAAGLIQPADPLRHLLSFANLMELHVLRGLRRDHDVHMSRIRTALGWLTRNDPAAHPLLNQSLETDGVDLFLQEYGTLINASRDGQLAMKAVFEAHLRRIQRDDQGHPIRFFPFTRKMDQDAAQGSAQPRTVAIDPRIAFGRPVIAGSRIPTIEVAERFTAGDSIAAIAADYECPTEKIEEAIRWEQVAA